MSSDPKNYFGFTFDEFTELDCRAFSLFETVPGYRAFRHRKDRSQLYVFTANRHCFHFPFITPSQTLYYHANNSRKRTALLTDTDFNSHF